MLSQVKIPDTVCDLLGEADIESAALFGSLCRDEAGMHDFFKRVLKVDPDQRDADFVTRARLTMVWEASKIQAEVETRAAVDSPRC